MDSLFCYNMISRLMNGLIDSKEDVDICNTITRQVSPWIIESAAFPVGKEVEHGRYCILLIYNRVKLCKYLFGFDPATNEFKLACLWNILSSHAAGKHFIYCVLTVGRQGYNTWRRIDRPRTYELTDDSIHVNGFIYRSTCDLILYVWPSCIVAGDVQSEKFQAITLPDFIPIQSLSRYQVASFPYLSDCLEVDGHLAMLIKTNGRSLTDLGNDDWLVSEILTRLPVKSLFRFKSVCKRWSSFIQHDQHFIDLHFTRSEKRPPCRLFFVVPVPQTEEEDYLEQLWIDHWPYKEFFITADLLFEDKGRMKVVVDTARKMDSPSLYNLITKPVKGLICLIDSEFSYSVRICNICTGEVSPWIESAFLVAEEKDEQDSYRDWLKENYISSKYQLGFDPATNEHKLVCVWKFVSSDGIRSFVCYVLTVGRQGYDCSNTWRRIDDVLPCEITDDSVYVNGVIYWSSFLLERGPWGIKHRPICIVAFDVGSEKFRSITIPDFILDHPRDHYKMIYDDHPYYDNYIGHVNLLEVDGSLAVLIKMNKCMFQMYIYEDDYKEEISRTFNNERWSEVIIRLPYYLDESQIVRFHSLVGSDDKIILTSSEKIHCGLEVGKKKCVSIHCYNWKKGRWTEFEVSGIPSSVPHLCAGSFFATFSESLLPLNNHTTLA